MSSLPEHLPERLRLLGLGDNSRILTHVNRTVMVSIGSDGTVRIHRGYAWASDRVLRAVVRFLDPRSPGRVRRQALRELLAFPAEQSAPPAAGGTPATSTGGNEDVPIAITPRPLHLRV